MNSEEVMCGFATDYKIQCFALILRRFYAIIHLKVGVFMQKKTFSIINGIVFGVIFVLILIESIFNIFGLWTAWNLFGFLIGLLLLPILNIFALISAVGSIIIFYGYKKTNDNVSFRKIGLLPIIFFTLGLFLTIIAYIFVLTWGFGILYQ